MIVPKIKSIISNELVYLKYALDLKHQTNLSSEKAMGILNKFYPQKKPAFRQNNSTAPTADLQIIVPIYNVKEYLDEPWDYVITVCGGANEKCPTFVGKVGKRIHIGFDDPAKFVGDERLILDGFRRVRDEIRERFYAFYRQEILPAAH